TLRRFPLTVRAECESTALCRSEGIHIGKQNGRADALKDLNSKGYAAGSSIQKIEPPSSGHSTPTQPCCSSTRCFTIHKPNPVLLSPLVGRGLSLPNCVNRRLRSPAGMPGP